MADPDTITLNLTTWRALELLGAGHAIGYLAQENASRILLTLGVCAALSGRSVRALRGMTSRGELKYVGRSHRYVRLSDLARLCRTDAWELLAGALDEVMSQRAPDPHRRAAASLAQALMEKAL